MARNECAKTRPVDNPYEVWEGYGWKWRVLKKYQTPEGEKKNKYARWFCAVKTPFVVEPNYEMGDMYVSDIVNHAVRTDKGR